MRNTGQSFGFFNNALPPLRLEGKVQAREARRDDGVEDAGVERRSARPVGAPLGRCCRCLIHHLLERASVDVGVERRRCCAARRRRRHAGEVGQREVQGREVDLRLDDGRGG